MSWRIIQGNCLDLLHRMEAGSVHCVITSPPYWALRDYNVEGQLGLEDTPEKYIEKIVGVFREARRVLRDDGVCFVNLGDSYVGSSKSGGPGNRVDGGTPYRIEGTPTKQGIPGNLVGIPWRVALALQADGWILRRDIIWSKPNPMPESVNGWRWERCRVKVGNEGTAKAATNQGSVIAGSSGALTNAVWQPCPGCPKCEPNGGYVLRKGSGRCSTAHEYVFQLVKTGNYYYDCEAVKEPLASDPKTWGRHSKKDPGLQALNPRPMFGPGRGDRNGTEWGNGATRNKRSVWEIATQPFSGAKLIADYVGDDGKPYRASPDCPIHGHLSGSQTQQTGECDEPQGRAQSCSAGSTNDRDQEHQRGSASINSHERNESEKQNAGGHILENNRGNKNDDFPQMAEPQKNHSNNDNPEKFGDSLGSEGHACSQIATDRNKQTSKMGRVPLTISPCISSAQRTGGIDDKSASRETVGRTFRNHESNTLGAAVLDELASGPLAQTESHNANTDTYHNGSMAKCSCKQIVIDHFATYPEELVEICIKAGTSQKGCCLNCGAPWARILDDSEEAKARLGSAWHDHKDDLGVGQRGAPPALKGPAKITWGWRPTCDCNAGDPVPCMVYDPFTGSGTSGAVAVRHGRDFIGHELSGEYIELAEKRIWDAAEKAGKITETTQRTSDGKSTQLGLFKR